MWKCMMILYLSRNKLDEVIFAIIHVSLICSFYIQCWQVLIAHYKAHTFTPTIGAGL